MVYVIREKSCFLLRHKLMFTRFRFGLGTMITQPSLAFAHIANEVSRSWRHNPNNHKKIQDADVDSGTDGLTPRGDGR